MFYINLVQYYLALFLSRLNLTQRESVKNSTDVKKSKRSDVVIKMIADYVYAGSLEIWYGQDSQ
jgi:hypothetical protein